MNLWCKFGKQNWALSFGPTPISQLTQRAKLPARLEQDLSRDRFSRGDHGLDMDRGHHTGCQQNEDSYKTIITWDKLLLVLAADGFSRGDHGLDMDRGHHTYLEEAYHDDMLDILLLVLTTGGFHEVTAEQPGIERL